MLNLTELCKVNIPKGRRGKWYVEKFEVKDVKPGHARNFLIPQGLAKPATKEALLWLESLKEVEEKKAEEEKKETKTE